MGDFYGKYRGVVTDNNDPLKLGRIKARVPNVSLDANNIPLETAWSLPNFPYGGNPDSGQTFIPDVGASVWIEFEAPCEPTSQTIWTGCFTTITEASGQPEIPEETRGEISGNAPYGKGTIETDTADWTYQDRADELKVDIEYVKPTILSADGTGLPVDLFERGPTSTVFDEPQSPNATTYPDNKSIKTSSGLMIELDDTTGNTRIHIYHPEGAYTEYSSGGKKVDKSTASYEYALFQKVLHVLGKLIEVIDGDRNTTIRGDRYQWIDGKLYCRVGKDVRADLGTTKIKTKELNITAKGRTKVESSGTLEMKGDALLLFGVAGVQMGATGDYIVNTIGSSVPIPGIGGAVSRQENIYNGSFEVNTYEAIGLVSTPECQLKMEDGVVYVHDSITGATRKLVTEDALTKIKNHTHPTAAVGLPSVSADLQATLGLGTDLTSNLKAT